MLDNVKVRLIRNNDSTENLFRQIAYIKSFHWHYPIEEHMRWMKENIKQDDFHLLIFSEDIIVAYMNMVHRKIELAEKEYLFLGIGNVCVHGEYLNHKLGILLMDVCKFYLGSLNGQGILFCKDNLVPFYTKAGWIHYKGKVICNDAILQSNTFFSTSGFSDAPLIKIDSTF